MRVRPRGADSARTDHGEDAVFLAASYGLIPDDWQEDLAIDWLLLGDDGKWLSKTCGIAVARQNGKNAAIEIRELFGMVVLGEKILHTAHEVKTARKAFKRLKHFFGEQVNDPNAKYPELNALVVEVRNTNGQEAIVLRNGGSVEIVARSKGSGRGFTVDVLILDEAQDLSDDELEALLPTISAAPLGNPQIIFAGTPPNADKGESGEVFLRVRQDGEPGGDLPPLDPFLAWTDFGVADGPIESVALDSDEVLYATNPALRTGRLQRAVAQTERRRFSPEGYARERLGWWGNIGKGSRPDVFGEGKWEAVELEDGDRPDPSALGVSVSPDGTRGAIAVVAPWGDGTYLLGAQDQRDGTAWMKKELKRIQGKTGAAVVINSKGPASSLIKPLQKAGVHVTAITAEEDLLACSDLFNAVGNATATHMGDEELTTAVVLATMQPVGSRWRWGLRTSAGDITMLDAATVAWHGRDSAYDIEDSFL